MPCVKHSEKVQGDSFKKKELTTRTDIQVQMFKYCFYHSVTGQITEKKLKHSEEQLRKTLNVDL